MNKQHLDPESFVHDGASKKHASNVGSVPKPRGRPPDPKKISSGEAKLSHSAVKSEQSSEDIANEAARNSILSQIHPDSSIVTVEGACLIADFAGKRLLAENELKYLHQMTMWGSFNELEIFKRALVKQRNILVKRFTNCCFA